MSLSTMTPAGEEQVPTRGGGVSLELLTRISLLEQRVADIEKHATADEYGIVKLSNSESVTNSEGLAVPASELNAAIEGTIANKINMVNESLARNTPKFVYITSKTSEKTVSFTIDYTTNQNEAYLISTRSHVSGANNAIYMLSYTTNTWVCLTEIARVGGMVPTCSVNGKTVTIDFWDSNGGGYSVIKLF